MTAIQREDYIELINFFNSDKATREKALLVKGFQMGLDAANAVGDPDENAPEQNKK